jgi:aspartyl-tRNA synthetase
MYDLLNRKNGTGKNDKPLTRHELHLIKRHLARQKDFEMAELAIQKADEKAKIQRIRQESDARHKEMDKLVAAHKRQEKQTKQPVQDLILSA